MTRAENHETLINGARNRAEFDRQVNAARADAIAEVFDATGQLCAMEFSDGSCLGISTESMQADVNGAA